MAVEGPLFRRRRGRNGNDDRTTLQRPYNDPTQGQDVCAESFTQMLKTVGGAKGRNGE